MKKIDIIGKQFRYLTVIKKDLKSGNYLCKCKCGKEKYIKKSSLVGGKTKSCGCYSIEKSIEIHSLKIEGKKFGKLLAIKPTNKRKDGCVVWEFECDCGKITHKVGTDVVSGHTRSCGCIIQNWKGDSVGYSGLHKWIAKKLGKPKICEYCGEEYESRIMHWANISHLYKRNINDWVRLCVFCHNKYDRGIIII